MSYGQQRHHCRTLLSFGRVSPMPASLGFKQSPNEPRALYSHHASNVRPVLGTFVNHSPEPADRMSTKWWGLGYMQSIKTRGRWILHFFFGFVKLPFTLLTASNFQSGRCWHPSANGSAGDEIWIQNSLNPSTKGNEVYDTDIMRVNAFYTHVRSDEGTDSLSTSSEGGKVLTKAEYVAVQFEVNISCHPKSLLILMFFK